MIVSLWGANDRVTRAPAALGIVSQNALADEGKDIPPRSNPETIALRANCCKDQGHYAQSLSILGTCVEVERLSVWLDSEAT
jgi:hypothetical protein